MLINADFHIHSSFSGGTSQRITMKKLAEGAKKKGLDLIATGDCLHEGWLNEIREGKMEDGIISYNGMNFILTAEIEDMHRVHHLLLFPSYDSIEEFKKIVEKKCKDCDEGRPHILLNQAELLDAAHTAGSVIGAAHAFTPWTSLYAYFDSISCYGGKPDFIELGLSADSDYADRIEELNDVPFLSNSDAHSPSPFRLGREFNRMEVKEITWDEVEKAIKRGRIINVGFPPEKGKYNRTACSSCYRQYSVEEARKMKWKCYCGGVIKKGVRDRIEELATFEKPRHPRWRGKYIHMLPLAEIIAHALGMHQGSSLVIKRWNELLRIGNEIEIMLDIGLDEIKKATPPAIYNAIRAFREGKIKIIPGGGGRYGEIFIEEEVENDLWNR